MSNRVIQPVHDDIVPSEIQLSTHPAEQIAQQNSPLPTTMTIDKEQDAGAPISRKKRFLLVGAYLLVGALGGFFCGSLVVFWSGAALTISGIGASSMVFSAHYGILAMIVSMLNPLVGIFGAWGLLYGFLTNFVIYIVGYALLLKFVLRIKHVIVQSLLSFFLVAMIAATLLGVNDITSSSSKLSATRLLILATLGFVLGGCSFSYVYFAAKRSDKGASMRSAKLVLVIILLAINTGIAQYSKNRYDTAQSDAEKYSQLSKSDAEHGVYNFSTDYQQYFPDSLMLDSYDIIAIAGPGTSDNLITSNAYKTVPTTSITIREKIGVRDQEYGIVESRRTVNYNPPKRCGNPNPTDDARGIGTWLGDLEDIHACTKAASLSNGDPVYVRQSISEQNVSYSMDIGGTLVTVTSPQILIPEDIVRIYTGLKPITPDKLLEKSKAQKNK